MNRLYFRLLILFAVPLASCQKVIDLDLSSAPSQLVIEGNITDRSGSKTVKISRSVGYGEANVFPAVSGATVIVKDNANGSWTFVETQPGVYTSPSFRGSSGRTYTLTVTAEGKQYTAKSMMPVPTPLDSVSIKTFSFGGEDSRQVQVHYIDPGFSANYYRYVVRVNGVQERGIFTENDRFTNGNIVNSVLFYDDPDDKNKQFELNPGDSVEVEMQCIDADIFTYWFTMMQQTQNGPGGGTVPGNPPSNISNKALGYFSAHTVQTRSIVVP